MDEIVIPVVINAIGNLARRAHDLKIPPLGFRIGFMILHQMQN